MVQKDFDARAYYKWAGVGFEFAGVVGLFFYFGYLADQRWGHPPWGLLIGGAIGFTGGLYLLIKEGFAMNRELNPQHREKDKDRPTEPRR
jgi:F0F1-type ATP synthase assembly protein I